MAVVAAEEAVRRITLREVAAVASTSSLALVALPSTHLLLMPLLLQLRLPLLLPL